MTPDGLGPKTRQLDVSSTASVEIENLRASWAAMINSALDRAQIPDKVDHRSFERQGKSTEPTVKMGPVNTAIERRVLRSSRPYPAPQPVTARGQLNATIKEIRGLTLLIERGLSFIESEALKLVVATKNFKAGTKRLANLAILQRIAGNIGRGLPPHIHQEPRRDRKRER